MDPITHSLAGATISRLGFKRKASLWVLLIASVAPDLDYISRIWGPDMFLRYHRGITHGLLALLVIPLIIALKQIKIIIFNTILLFFDVYPDTLLLFFI